MFGEMQAALKLANLPDKLLNGSGLREKFEREGRGRGLSLGFITQRIQDFPKLLWSQCYMNYLLKFTLPQGIS